MGHRCYLLLFVLGFIVFQQLECAVVFDCTFEEKNNNVIKKSNCGFTLNAISKLAWNTAQGTLTDGTGPSEDHTDTMFGYFLYIDANWVNPGTKARIDSPQLRKPASDVDGCLQFYYHMWGSDIGTLNVSVFDSAQNGIVSTWQKSGDQGNQWLRADLDLNLPAGTETCFQIVFEATVAGTFSGNNKGDIAIDDIVVKTDGSCSVQSETAPTTGSSQTTTSLISSAPTWSCDFDNSLNPWCDFPKAKGWVEAITSHTPSTGPQVDKSGAGYFAVMVAAALKPNTTYSLVTPILQGFSCLSFYYHMYGSGMGQLKVFMNLKGNYQEMWSQTGNQGNQWKQVFIPVPAGANSFRWDAIRGLTDQSDIAIDEIVLTTTDCHGSTLPPTTTTTPTTPPTTRAQPSIAFACNFDDGFCSMYQDKTDTFDWSRMHFPTWSSDTGPNSDHTWGDEQGYYVYTEASYKQTGSKARLMTGIINTSSSSGCLRFSYHMWGSQMGTLNVAVKDERGNTLASWSNSGDQGNLWRQADVNVTFISNKVYLQFEGVIQHSGAPLAEVKGDIAIDDIILTSTGSCNDLDISRVQTEVTALSTTPTAGPTESTTPSTTTKQPSTMPSTSASPTTPAPVIVCNFDEDECEYQQDGSDDFDWRRINTRTWSDNTGPQFDHTSGDGSGYYMYIEASYKMNNTKGRLMSPSLTKLSNTGCLSFFYHMWGQQMGTFNVYLKTAQSQIKLLTKSGDQGNQWLSANLDLDLSSSNTFQVVFEGIVKHDLGDYADVLGDIAIDDVTINRVSECTQVSTTSSSTTSHITSTITSSSSTTMPHSSSTTMPRTSSTTTITTRTDKSTIQSTTITTKSTTQPTTINESTGQSAEKLSTSQSTVSSIDKTPEVTTTPSTVLINDTNPDYSEGNPQPIVQSEPSNQSNQPNRTLIAGVTVVALVVLIAVVAIVGVIIMRRRQLWLFAPGTRLSVAFRRSPASETAVLENGLDGVDNQNYAQSTGSLQFQVSTGGNLSDV